MPSQETVLHSLIEAAAWLNTCIIRRKRFPCSNTFLRSVTAWQWRFDIRISISIRYRYDILKISRYRYRYRYWYRHF